VNVRLDRLVAVVAALVSATGVVAGCGPSAQHSASTGSSRAVAASFSGPTASPPFPAKPLVLRDYQGHPVDLGSYRGKALLVTFIYTHCPDVCPLIMGNLHAAQAMLGRAAGRLQIIAVSTDPRGDTPRTVAAFLRAHQMTGRMRYLIGTRAQLGRVWRTWGIVARPAKANPDLVEHSAEIFGIGADGKVYTLYPANFKPRAIAHDVPILAAR
jgi:protein SCO1